MPLFFLLSGYSLTVVYGSKKSNLVSVVDSEENVDENSVKSTKEASTSSKLLAPTFDTIKFHVNRFARVFPTYYFCNIIALPLWFYGYGSCSPSNLSTIIMSLVFSIIPIMSLTCFMFGIVVINLPGWTICTLAIFWILFPYSFSSLNNASNEDLVKNITICYWIQCFLVIFFFVLIMFLAGFENADLAFKISTMQPLIRYPCFLMGVYAGELTRRSPTGFYFFIYLFKYLYT
jgi:peptidoglycan/LPS O-acetylase OafA/YrhL